MAKETDKKDPWFTIVSILSFLLIVGLWCWNYCKLVDLDDAERGTFGDMFGASNSLFSGLALAGIIITILLQRKELKLQREELSDTRKEFQIQNETLKIQRFENTFFHLLDQHHQIVNAIDFTFYKKKEKERKVYYTMVREISTNKPEDLEVVVLTGRDVFRHTFHILSNDLNANDYNVIYLEHYEGMQTDYGHYFRNLYRILKIIDETDFFYDSNIITQSEIFETKYRYASILRAQISDYELAWLFYNCLSENGVEKFKPLIEKYSFFNNLHEGMIIHKQHWNLYDKSAYDKKYNIQS